MYSSGKSSFRFGLHNLVAPKCYRIILMIPFSPCMLHFGYLNHVF